MSPFSYDLQKPSPDVMAEVACWLGSITKWIKSSSESVQKVCGCPKRWVTRRGMEPRTPYPTDLTDKGSGSHRPSVPAAKPGGRPEKYPKRESLTGLLYILRGGCAWRLLPHDFPPWQIVDQYFWHFWRWQQDGTWQSDAQPKQIRGAVRVAVGQYRQARAGIIESQSVKTTEKGGSTVLIRPHRSRGVHGISSSIR